MGVRSDDGLVSHFGGKVEPQERPVEAALREFGEETGWCGCGGMKLEHLANIFTPGGRMSYVHFIGIVAGEFEPDLSFEHTEAAWMHIGDIQALRDSLHPAFAAMWERRGGYVEERIEEILSFSGLGD